MQLAVITDEIDEDLERALAVMAEYGVRAAEIRSVWGKNISTMSDAEIARVKQTVAAAGASTVGIASPVFKCDLPGGEQVNPLAAGPLHGGASIEFDEQSALLERCIDIADRLGASLLRTFTFWRHGPMTPEIEDRIVAAYSDAAEMAEQRAITLVVENEHACFTGTGAETARVVSRIASPAVKIVWDPGNAVFAGERAFPDGYREVEPFMAHVHAKDARPAAVGPDPLEWVAIGEGIVDWPAQIRALSDSGYSGFVSLETHFADGGSKEAASRRCLDALKRLVG